MKFNSYEELEKYLDEDFVCEAVDMKEGSDGVYPQVLLDDIISLGLSESMKEYAIGYLKRQGVVIEGKEYESRNDRSYDAYQMFQKSISPTKLTVKEREEKAALYAATKDPVIREQLVLNMLPKALYTAYKYAKIFGVDFEDLVGCACEGLLLAVDSYNINNKSSFITTVDAAIYKEIKHGVHDVIEHDSKTVEWFRCFIDARDQIEQETGKDIYSDGESIRKLIDIMDAKGVNGSSSNLYEKALRISLLQKESLEELTNFYEDEREESKIDELMDSESLDDAVDRLDLQQKIEEALDILTDTQKAVIKARFGFEDGTPKKLGEIGEELGINRERVRQIEIMALHRLRNMSKTKALKEIYNGGEIPQTKQHK